MIGPGKYDAEASDIMDSTQAAGVVLLVVEGHKGSGFSVHGTLAMLADLPAALRAIADAVETDVAKMKGTP